MEHPTTPTADKASAARDAVRRGWAPIPLHHLSDEALGRTEAACSCQLGARCHSKAKHPLHAKWQDQEPMSLADIEAVWGEDHPDANIGIVTGARSGGLLVIDEDEPGALDELVGELGPAGEALMRSFTVRTGGGGRHVYLQLPDGVRIGNTKGRLHPKIDTRADGGFVVYPGSISAKGDTGTYDVVADVAVQPAPAALLDRLSRKITPQAQVHTDRVANPSQRQQAYVDRAIVGELERLDRLRAAMVPGDWQHQYRGPGWDDEMFSVACNLVELVNTGAGPSLADMRTAFVARCPTDKDWSTVDSDLKWISAEKRVGENSRRLPNAEEAEVTLADEEVAVEVRSSWAPVDLVAFFAGNIPPAQPTLWERSDGVKLIYPGLVSSVIGESESGKSFIMHALSAEILKNGGRVGFLDYESGMRTVVPRLRMMGASVEQIVNGFTYITPELDPTTGTSDDLAYARQFMAETYDLVVIDGVTAALGTFGKETNSNDDVTVWMRRFPIKIAKVTGAAVVLIDHVAKNRESGGRYAIGAQAKMAMVEGANFTVEVVEPLGRGRRGELKLLVGKDREGAIREHGVGFNAQNRTEQIAQIIVDSRVESKIVVEVHPPALTTTTGADGTVRAHRTGYMARLSTVLQLAGGRLVQSALMKETEGKAEWKQEALKSLVELEFVRIEKAGARNMVIAIKPYTENPAPQGLQSQCIAGCGTPVTSGACATCAARGAGTEPRANPFEVDGAPTHERLGIRSAAEIRGVDKRTGEIID